MGRKVVIVDSITELLHETDCRCTDPGFCYTTPSILAAHGITMSEFTIYHNPRCSKSRMTLALLEENSISPEVVLYLETPLGENDINTLLGKLTMSASQLVRKGEADFKDAGLSKDSSDADIVAAMSDRPKLIERPIVVRGDKAVLGRPPENVLALLT
jgi:arsenate reductase